MNKIFNKDRFKVSHEMMVVDQYLKIYWIKTPHDLPGNEYIMEWDKACIFCKNLLLYNFANWRLPSCDELSSLIIKDEPNTMLPEKHPFIGIKSDFYWSSTELRGNSDFAWRVPIKHKSFVGRSYKTNKHFVWPVHSLA